MPRHVYQFILFCLLTSPLWGEIKVETRFNPATVIAGDTAQYIITISETSTSSMPQAERIQDVQLPDTADIKIRNGRPSTSSSTQIINGRAEYELTLNLVFDAIPPRAGNFRVPRFRLDYKSERLVVPAAALEVRERAASDGPTAAELIFLKYEIPDSLYLGQTIQTDLKLYVYEGINLADLNSFDRSADAFILSELPQNPSESIDMNNGRRYRVLTWPFTLTPIQRGQQELSFQFGISIYLPKSSRNQRFSQPGSPFGPDMLDQFFSRRERLNVFTDTMQVDVKPLPEANQPKSFSGAIGDFNFQAYVDTETTNVGEPIMLSVEISGTGNFERIENPLLEDSDQWRIYSPESQFEGSDQLGLRGVKRFDYVSIPQVAGDLKLPPIRFSFFDPESAEYVTLESPSIPVEVFPSNIPSAPIQTVKSKTSEGNGTKTEEPPQPKLSAEEALLVLDYKAESTGDIDGNWLHDAKFYTAHGVIALAFLATGFYLRRQKRLQADANYALLRQSKLELQSAQSKALQAASSGDAELFYAEAARALRLQATCRSRKDLRNAEVVHIANAFPKEAKDSLVSLFQSADAHRFSRHPKQSELLKDQQQFETLLRTK